MSQRQKQPRQWHLRARQLLLLRKASAGGWSPGMRSGCRERWLLLLLCRAGVSLVTLLASSQVPSHRSRAAEMPAPHVLHSLGVHQSWLRGTAIANRRIAGGEAEVSAETLPSYLTLLAH